MNNIFDIKRFGKYLMYDLNNARNQYSVSFIIVSLMPIVVFTILNIVRICFGLDHSYFNGISIFAVIMSYFIAVITFPAKAYGGITDKRKGSNFLLVPASSFEKSLSMIVICCIIFPVLLWAVFFASDSLLSAIFPMSYGTGAIGMIKEWYTSDISEYIQISLPAIGAASWCSTILAFALGAILFKKSKAAKTILCLMALGMVYSSIFAALGENGLLDNLVARFGAYDSDFEMSKALNMFNVWSNISTGITIAALSAGIFFRIKTLKH